MKSYGSILMVSSGLLAGCVSLERSITLDPVGPAILAAPKKSPEGRLIVYTPDDSLWHSESRRPSSYKIYSETEELLRDVANHTNSSIDQDPTPISLLPGQYKVRARANGYGLVTVPVVIEEGRLTEVFLDHGSSSLASQTEAANLVRLPNGVIVGCRAKPVAPTP